jgi:hypothetical protein
MILKAISPFIASVLLISFTIASGIIVYYFLTTLPKVQTQQVSSLSQQVISCAGGFFDINTLPNTLPIGIYRKAITIDNTANSNNLNDYQVLITNPIYNETGLVLSLHFNEGSGTVAYDSSGNNNNGNLVNGPTWVDGKFGKALSFDGNDDYMQIISGGGLNTFTISLWIKTNESRASPIFWQRPTIFGKSNGGSGSGDFGIITNNGYIGFWSGLVSGDASYLSSTTRINDNNWHHIVVSNDGSHARLYVDGRFEASLPTGFALNNEPFWIGGKGGSESPGFYHSGIIDEVRFYNRALSDAEIQALYQAKARLDYEDIRFTDSDGSTLLNYWQEADGRFWVKVPSIPASSTKTIYVYYGNPGATSASNGTLTFDFFDDFLGTSLDTSKWYVVAGTSYTVSNSILKITVGAIGLQSALSFNLNSGYLTEAKIQYNSNIEDRYSGVLEISSSRFTASGNGNADATVLYMVDYPASSSSVKTWIGNGGTATYNIANDATVFTMALNTWYILGVESTPSTAAVWKDYSRLNNYAVSWAKNINYLSLGAFHGAGTYDIKDTSYDWVRVRKYTSPEPTVSISSEENITIITISLLSSGSPSASMGNQFTSVIYLTNGTIVQKDFSLDNNCNLGKDCPLGKSTISLNYNVPIDKIKVCSKACSLICNEIKVS